LVVVPDSADRNTFDRELDARISALEEPLEVDLKRLAQAGGVFGREQDGEKVQPEAGGDGIFRGEGFAPDEFRYFAL
jgi:hypothetical protein